jgi:glycosyltransferase involved in cell wall biosynthesis
MNGHREENGEPLTTSVVMATYNGARYLPEQLASLAAQERLPDELVITDDGSSDDTAKIVESFAQSASFPVRFHPNAQRLGVRDNFQRALSLAQGDILLLCDQDDLWFPSKIRRLAEILEQETATLLVMNDKIITDEALRPSDATMLSNLRNYGASASLFVAGCCSAFRRSWLDVALPIPDGIAYHDVWIIGLAHDLGAVRLCEEPLQYYRRHGTNVSQGRYNENGRVSRTKRLLWDLALLMKKKAEGQKAVWETEALWATTKAARLREREAALARLGLGDAAAAVRDRLMTRAAWVKERHRLASLGIVGRAIGGLNLWRRGGYSEFGGWKSLVMDLTLR